MSTIINAAPKVILNGIQDLSTRVVPREPEQVPMHLPLFFSFAQKGPSKTQLLSNVGEVNDLFGDKTLDYKSEYASHITPFINTIIAQGNAVMFKRLLPADASVGGTTLLLHVTTSTINVYERNPDGSFKLDEYGDRIPVEGKTVSGYKLKWEQAPIDPNTQIGTQEPIVVNDTTTIYPILEFRASSKGSFSGNIGFKLSVPTTDSSSQPDLELIKDNKIFLLRISLVQRPDELSSFTIINNLSGETSVDFTLKKNIVDKYSIEKYLSDAVVPSYQDLSTPGFLPVYSPIGEIYLYEDNSLTIASKILEAEKKTIETVGESVINPENMDVYEVNYFTGVNVDNIHYTSIEYDLSAEVGKTFVLLNENNTHFLSKGSDGDISNESLNSCLRSTITNGWDDPEDPLADMALNPYSCFWDTGFDLDTKKVMCETLGVRKDTYVFLSTYEYGTDPLNWAEEESMANIIKSYAAGYPESIIYGTSVARAVMIGGRGYTVDNVYKPSAPLALDLSQKVAIFMGASDGRMKAGLGFDVSPNNQITLLRDVTGAYKTERQRQRDWDAGMVWAQNYDRRSLFYPAVQTVYQDDTSVLNSAINMFIAAELEKVCEYVWRNLTGNAKLTKEQFIEASDAMIIDRTTNRFDDRVTIVPETFYTAADNARGYSWSCRINMYANNMKTVGTFTIVARRQDELAA